MSHGVISTSADAEELSEELDVSFVNRFFFSMENTCSSDLSELLHI
jgi:hypothetical protein